jgi:ABC-2 type transport system ATP-binding protein
MRRRAIDFKRALPPVFQGDTHLDTHMDMSETQVSTTPAARALPDLAVEIRGLNKLYTGSGKRPPKQAVADFALEVPRGSFFGLLGPNGAGKSTTINIMAGLVKKTSGVVKIWDFDLDTQERQARCAIGVVPQELNLDPFFTPFEILEVQAGLYGVPKKERRTKEILDVIGLADKANAYARALSGGMRRRLLIGKALVHTPPVLVLDEPTAGVDVELRQQLWKHLRALNARGTTILLTTHYLEEAEALCDRIAIINHGRLVACDTTRALLRRIDNKAVILTLTQPLAQIPAALANFHATLPAPHELHINYRPSAGAMQDILDAVRAAGLTVGDIRTDEVELEDIFLQLTAGSSQLSAQ